jgi:hypothetical protein
MYNLASKPLAHLSDPLTLALLLSVCALLFWKRRRLALRLLILSVAFLLVFSSKVVSNALVRSLEDQYHDYGLDVPPAQAIVVLGGTIHMPSGSHQLAGLVDSSESPVNGVSTISLWKGASNPLQRRAQSASRPIRQDSRGHLDGALARRMEHPADSHPDRRALHQHARERHFAVTKHSVPKASGESFW